MAELSTAPHPRPDPQTGARDFQSDEVYYYAELYGSSNQRQSSSNNSAWEIEEEEDELFEIRRGEEGSPPLASIKEEIGSGEVNDDDCVYVGVGKGESSADAVAWASRNTNAGATVYLIHVFPEVRHIPSPRNIINSTYGFVNESGFAENRRGLFATARGDRLTFEGLVGKLPKSQVSPEQVESYMAQERGKRRLLLQTFINQCSASKVKVDTILIESDTAGKAIRDLIPILNIKKLVLGTNKSNVKKLKHRKGNTNIADQVILNALEGCEISIVCQGQQVMTVDGRTGVSSPSPIKEMELPAAASNSNNVAAGACMCFKSPRVTS